MASRIQEVMLLWAFAAFAVSSTAAAQVNAGNLTGRVVGGSPPGPLADVSVSVTSREGARTGRETKTNEHGRYFIQQLSAGCYKVRFGLVGSQPEEWDGCLQVGRNNQLSVKLVPQAADGGPGSGKVTAVFEFRSLPLRRLPRAVLAGSRSASPVASPGSGRGEVTPGVAPARGPRYESRAARVAVESRDPDKSDSSDARERSSGRPSLGVVDTTSKEIVGNLTSHELDALPTQNRSALLFAALVPGVIPSPSSSSTSADSLFINGRDDNDNFFYMDGVANNNDFLGSQDGALVRTPMEAIREFQVMTAQFNAEFGRSVGGVLNAVTKSGSNEFHGSAFAYFQDSAWNEPNFFVERGDEEPADDEFRALGFSLGGPISRDRAHFFVSYEDALDREGHNESFSNTEMEFRPDPYTATEDNDIENVFAKLDYQASSRQHATARFLREESPQFNKIVDISGRPVTLDGAREEGDTDANWSVSLDSGLGATAWNTGRVSYVKEDLLDGPPGVIAGGVSFARQSSLPPRRVHKTFDAGPTHAAFRKISRSLQADDTFSIVREWRGLHALRWGVQYSDSEVATDSVNFANGIFNFAQDARFDHTNKATYPNRFRILVGDGARDSVERESLGLFVQDDWGVGSNLTLSLGLRYEKEDITRGAYLAPRVGFAWDPSGLGRTVIRGGYGRFYDRFPLDLFRLFSTDSLTSVQAIADIKLPPPKDPPIEDPPRLLHDDCDPHPDADDLESLEELRECLIGTVKLQGLNLNPTVDHPGRRQPYNDTLSLGVERELRPGIAVGLDLVRTANKDSLLEVDLNPSSDRMQGQRPHRSLHGGELIANMGAITTWINAGSNVYRAAQLSLRKRFDGRARLGGRLSYTYAESKGNYQGTELAAARPSLALLQTRTETGYNFDSGRIVGDPLNLGLDDWRTQGIPVKWHRDHNLVLSGVYRVPGTGFRENGGLVLSWVYRYLSGAHTTLTDLENNLDGSGRPGPAHPGVHYPTVDSDIGPTEIQFNGKLQGATEPDFRRLDLSLRYRIPIGERVVLTLEGDVFNATNEVNFQDLGGTEVRTPAFLIPSQAFNPREYQLGLRFDF